MLQNRLFIKILVIIMWLINNYLPMKSFLMYDSMTLRCLITPNLSIFKLRHIFVSLLWRTNQKRNLSKINPSSEFSIGLFTKYQYNTSTHCILNNFARRTRWMNGRLTAEIPYPVCGCCDAKTAKFINYCVLLQAKLDVLLSFQKLV